MSVPVTLPKEMALQYQDGAGQWVTAARCDAGSVLRTRRLALPPGRQVAARRWRIVRLHADPAAPVDLGAAVVRLTRLEVRRETAELSPFRRWAFDFDTGEQRYGLVATDGNVEVYQRGVRVASIASPYTADRVPDVKRAQVLDTLLAFHPDVPPYRFARQGAHSEWDSRPQAFENIPRFDYDGTRAGGISEVQQLSFADFVNGETFNLTLEGQTTGAIAYDANMTTLAASVAAAMNALDNVGANGVAVTSPSDKVLRIAYQGKNRNEDVGEIVAQVLISEKGIVRTATVTQGKEGGEPVISDTRGWPSAGVFFDSRLWLAAPRSRPQTILASRSGFFFDLNIKGGEADKGISVDLATDQSTRILNLFAGRHLQVFSQSAEFFCASQPITPPPAFPRTSSVGLAPGTPLLEMEGGTLFIQAGGDTVAHFAYEDGAQSYVATPLSSYAPHLTKGIVAGGFRRHRSTSEPNLALWIRADGTATAMAAILSQDVLGFAPWTTDGAFVEAGGELAGDLYVGVRRTSAGVERHRLEVLSDAHMLDASVRIEGPAAEITGLDHLEGRTVALYVDGADEGDAVVTGGRVVLPYPAERCAEAGLLFTPRGRLLPMVLEQDPRGGASMRARVGEVALRLGPTANLRLGMTGKKLWPVKLKRRGGAGAQAALLDHGPGEDAFEGWTRVYPIPGFQDDAQIDWEQPRPGPLEIREVVVTVQS
ncbi:hypothetical protein [Brevundimonas naejangsanensis]|uniref:hypothetical protein n=1 Tax=Brevundimonas naejangsanensis TaxID=588932 RepID=UPI0026EE4578|nr:hypothetical protein [Brevundimonas naejangsanensis]